MLTTKQIHALSEAIEAQMVFFIGNTLGQEYLSEDDVKVLIKNGIDPNKVYLPDADLVTNNFALGMMAFVLGKKETDKLTFKELVTYVKEGKHIPFSEEEKAVIRSIKSQSLSDIRAQQGNIFRDVNNLANTRMAQEKVIRETIIEGKLNRKNDREIIRELRKKTGDWNRNFQKSVQYISHTALNEGRAAIILRRNGALTRSYVFFHVLPGACKKCVELYLTDGEGSKPRVFTLAQLKKNGTNIGKKAADYKATLGALHVNCRCMVSEYFGPLEAIKPVRPKKIKPKEEIKPEEDIQEVPKPQEHPSPPEEDAKYSITRGGRKRLKIQVWINGVEHWV